MYCISVLVLYCGCYKNVESISPNFKCIRNLFWHYAKGLNSSLTFNIDKCFYLYLFIRFWYVETGWCWRTWYKASNGQSLKKHIKTRMAVLRIFIPHVQISRRTNWPHLSLKTPWHLGLAASSGETQLSSGT